MDATGIALILGAVTALMATAVGPGIRWYFQRRDAKTAEVKEKAEAIKTVASLELAIETKNAELTHVKDDRDRWRARAEHLETLLNRRLEGAT